VTKQCLSVGCILHDLEDADGRLRHLHARYELGCVVRVAKSNCSGSCNASNCAAHPIATPTTGIVQPVGGGDGRVSVEVEGTDSTSSHVAS